MNRSVLAGIGVPVAVVVGSVGFLLSAQHPTRPAGRTGAPASQSAPPVSAAPLSATPGARRSVHKHKSRHGHRHRSHSQNNSLPPPVTGGHVFVGVAVHGSIVASVRSFSRAAGVHMALVEIYARFGNSFPLPQAQRVLSVGSTPLVQWDPRGAPLAAIAAGKYNAYVHRWAKHAKAFGHGIVLSFGHEMNGPWSPWGPSHASPAQFVGAWRRIHNIFASEGVRNVSWSWDPSHTGDAPDAWWPGPAYVDRIGIDGYQRPGQTFADIFASRLADIRSFASKPIYIAETGVAPGPDQGAQIGGLFNGVRQFHLSGFCWFDINGLEPWRLEGRPSAIRAFRKYAHA